MNGDHVITQKEACELQDEAQQCGRLLIWTITHGTKDYGSRWVARPSMVPSIKPLSLLFPFVLIADTLRELRDMLPPGLISIQRQLGDEPVIVEVWL